MKITDEINEELWRLCQAYAFRYREFTGLPYELAEDIRGDAYLRSINDFEKLRAGTPLNGILSKICWSNCYDAIREMQNAEARALWHAKRIDGKSPGMLERDGGFGDRGAEASRIRYFDDPATPMWKYAVRYEESKLHGLERRIANGLMKTFCYEDVRKHLHLDNRRFWHNLKNLRVRFAQCFRAYREWCAENP